MVLRRWQRQSNGWLRIDRHFVRPQMIATKLFWKRGVFTALMMFCAGGGQAASTPAITQVLLGGNARTLIVQSDLGLTNQLQFKTNLSQPNWTPLTNFLVRTTPYQFKDFANTGASGFYRVVARPVMAGYYVDSVNGNDTNSGLSPTLALRTIAALSNLNYLRPTNVLNFAANSVWRESLGTPSGRFYSNTLFQAYGSGTPPLLDASDAIPTSAWLKMPGYNNIYAATVFPEGADSSPLAAGVLTINVYANGLALTNAPSLEALDTNGWGCYVASSSASPTTLFVNTTNGNPATNGILYEFSSRQVGLAALGVSNTVIGLWTRRNLHQTGSLQCGDYSVVSRCWASDGSKHNFVVGAFSSVYDTACSNAYFASGDNVQFVAFSPVTNGPVHFYNCSAIQSWPAVPAVIANCVGFYGHTGAQQCFTAITYSNCVSLGNSDAFDGWAENVSLTNCQGNGSIGVSGANTYIVGSTIYATNGRAASFGPSGQRLWILNSTVTTTLSGQEGIYGNPILSLVISNSFVGSSTNGFGIYASGAPLTNLVMYNSTISGWWGYYELAKPPISFKADNNTYVSAHGGSCVFVIGGTNYGAPYSGYQNAFAPNDLHSTFP